MDVCVMLAAVSWNRLHELPLCPGRRRFTARVYFQQRLYIAADCRRTWRVAKALLHFVLVLQLLCHLRVQGHLVEIPIQPNCPVQRDLLQVPQLLVHWLVMQIQEQSALLFLQVLRRAQDIEYG